MWTELGVASLFCTDFIHRYFLTCGWPVNNIWNHFIWRITRTKHRSSLYVPGLFLTRRRFRVWAKRLGEVRHSEFVPSESVCLNIWDSCSVFIYSPHLFHASFFTKWNHRVCVCVCVYIFKCVKTNLISLKNKCKNNKIFLNMTHLYHIIKKLSSLNGDHQFLISVWF